MALKSQYRSQLIDREPRLTQYLSQRTLGNLFVIWNNQTAVRWAFSAEDHVASSLVVKFIPELAQS